jgi:Ca2+-binding RTX toxin-like protein
VYKFAAGDRDEAFSNGWETDFATFDLAYLLTYGEAPLAVTLDGGVGSDTITGSSGVDKIIGGIGNDILTGNGGADNFIFSEAGDLHADTITDYNATEGDKLNLSSLLDASFDQNDLVAEFVRLVNDGTSVKVEVDIDGAGAADWAAVATLSNYHVEGNKVLVEFENQVHQLTVAA